MSRGSGVPLFNYCRPPGFRRRGPPGDDARRAVGLRWGHPQPRSREGPSQAIKPCLTTMQTDRQYSMIRVKNGVIPAFRTGLTVTLPALPDASNIWPLPKYMLTCWPPPGP